MAGTLQSKRLENFCFYGLGVFMLFIVSLAFVTIILAMFGISFEDAIVLAVACLTTTGPILKPLVKFFFNF